jgi:hypothetical protein
MSRILVVEDDPAIGCALEDDLRLEGYAVELVADGEAAIARARQDRFDLILLDVMLPKKDGFEVCRELRRAGVDSGIVLLTARGASVWISAPTITSPSRTVPRSCARGSARGSAGRDRRNRTRSSGSATASSTSPGRSCVAPAASCRRLRWN